MMRILWMLSLFLLPVSGVLAMERLHYKVKFGFLTAGKAEITFDARDDDTYRFSALAWTDSSLFELKERIVVEGSTDFKPSVFNMQQIENDYRAHKSVRLAGDTAIYQKNSDPQEEFPTHGAVRDYLSALFKLRSVAQTPELKAGQVLVENVIGLNGAYRMELKVLRKMSLHTPALGHRDVWELQPVLVKLAPKSGLNKNWRLYITADEERVPVRITAQLQFGSFNVLLTKREDSARGDKITSFASEGLQTGDIFPK